MARGSARIGGLPKLARKKRPGAGLGKARKGRKSAGF